MWQKFICAMGFHDWRSLEGFVRYCDRCGRMEWADYFGWRERGYAHWQKVPERLRRNFLIDEVTP